MLVRDGGSVGAREALGEVRKAAVHSRSADLVGMFLFKQKTAYEVRISDWSSDVCSSDLPLAVVDDEAVLRVAILPIRVPAPRRFHHQQRARLRRGVAARPLEHPHRR